jgi:hypothetical protein
MRNEDDSTLSSSQRIRPGLRLCLIFPNKFIFYGEGLQPHAQPPSWRTASCRLSAAAYSIYSQLISIAGGRSSICNPSAMLWGQGPT